MSMADADIDFREYRVVSIVFPRNTCGFEGLANVGVVNQDTDDGRVQISLNIMNGVEGIDNGVESHELGHNFGMLHANDYECGNVTLATNCQSLEYGDFFDILGNYLSKAQYNIIRKEKLGWLLPSEVVSNPPAGIYFLNPIEFVGGIKTLKFSLNDGKKLYAEYRRPVGYDSYFLNQYGGNLLDGLFLRTDKYAYLGDTQLLDTTPNSNSSQFYDSLEVAIKVGDVFENSQNGIYLETLELNNEYLKVRVGPHMCGDGVLDVDLGEQCDREDFGGTICTDVGLNGIFYDGGQMACRSDCTFDTNQCAIRASCPWDQDGNEIVNPADRGFVSVQLGCQVGHGNPLCDLADVNDDGFVTPADRGFVSANLGTRCMD